MKEGANPFATLAAAARGELLAQRALAHAAMLRFYDETGAPKPADCLGMADAAALIEGLAFARMAASHGDESDRNRLIAMLSIGNLLPAECSIPIGAEMIARASLWTERGSADPADAEADEFAGIIADQMTNEASPEVAAMAQQYRNLIIESEAV